LLQLKITSAQGDTTVIVNLGSNNQVFGFLYRKTPTTIVVDPNNWMLNQVGTITNGVVVPTVLLQLKGKSVNSCGYKLNWETTNEVNVLRYEIEYSKDGIYFSQAGTKSPRYQTDNIYEFDFSNEEQNSYFFRLKTIEFNGNYFYSAVIKLTSACKTTDLLSIYPNPVKDVLKFSMFSAENSDAQLSIYATTAGLVKRQNITLKKGINEVEVTTVAKLPSGMYLLSVTDAKGMKRESKFIKL
jgi:hypothetical protein